MTKTSYRPDEAADTIGVSRRSVYYMIKDGRLTLVPDTVTSRGSYGWRVTVESVEQQATIARERRERRLTRARWRIAQAESIIEALDA